MKFSNKILPSSLKNTLKKSGKQFGGDLLKLLIIEELEGKKAVKINFGFQQNASMYDLGPDVEGNLKRLKNSAQEDYTKLVSRVASHTFGDNVGGYVKSYDMDKGDGSWDLVITDIGYDGNWLTICVYLVPNGFEISE